MTFRLRVPIRVKFMLTFLVLVTGVVGLITFSTASLFQDDKHAYVNGMTSMVARGTAEEALSALVSYRERLRLYARWIVGGEVPEDKRETLSRTLFDEFPELVAVSVYQEGRPATSVWNLSTLEAAGLTREDLETYEREHPVPEARVSSDEPYVRNSTLTTKLPCFTMVLRQPGEAGSAPMRVVAVLRSDRLLSLTSRFSAYEQFLTDSDGALLADSDVLKVAVGGRVDLRQATESFREGRSSGVTKEYVRGGTEMIGGFAQVDFANVVAGAEIPRSAAHLASRRVVTRMLELAALLLVLAIVTGFLWAHRITRPMERLSAATREVAQGRFDVAVDVQSEDEMGELASSFNRMAVGLKQRDAALGEAHAQLVQSEKMAAFGQIGAGIAHEVKNPLTGILGCAQLAVDDVEEGSQVQQALRLIEKEARRCKSIIDNLLKFARQEKAEMMPTDVNGVVDDAVAIVNHQMEIHSIRVRKELGQDLPMVLGNANQLQQVFMNILINAQQAMEGKEGIVRIASVRRNELVELRFSDTGPGIPENIRAKLFEPFFTTKPTGKGTGLGLSVSFGIIKEHRGEIAVESEVGKGTTFVIALPALERAAAAADAEVLVAAGV